ncbi:hypothetical protein ABFU65_12040 [Xanthomonas campestris pv. raphani]|uniref:hypothetical protein n=1 Tax=Xanthomonas campestris TaxID=339 RepID=UPI002B22FB47|nr:hypothetical protein [Xanthomonas campestris]MEB1134233.1 hypothetical protein [Xanthomonas campestris pv. campestris]MEA9551726.1 hypothetical protein [Xanthomonas campestris]MEA9653073.1 hypothetical protein [Xanthomonas campestris pv. raphani]MEB1653846.1 hypothetical protein [Xanthomonas campestris pv. campestris]MEB1863571.1 hypothetical protein [Xanthomonas campestris pv. campestris]
MNEIEKRARELLVSQLFARGAVRTARALQDGQDGFIRTEDAEGAIIEALSAAPRAAPTGLADAASAALPFVAYAYSKGVAGAEEAGRAIESALASMPEHKA